MDEVTKAAVMKWFTKQEKKGCVSPGTPVPNPSELGTLLGKDFGDMPETILEEAARLVYGDREEAYEHPNQNFARIAGMFNALGYRRTLADGTTEEIKMTDVALMLICLKVARQYNKVTRDGWVDTAGYAACGARCTEPATKNTVDYTDADVKVGGTD